MRFSKKNFLLGAALLFLGTALGFGLGNFFGAAPLIGCRENDLTPVPDTEFLTPAPSSVPAVSQPPAPPEKWVCLTFDDGPSKTTSAVLEALNNAGVKATFFVVATGYNEKYLPLLAEASAAGHQIALHSASHEYSDIYRGSDAYWQDIALLKQRVRPYINAESIRYLRFPGGSTNTVSRRYGGKGLMKQLKSEVEQKGYQWVDWNVCAEDATASHPDAAQILRNIRRDAEGHDLCVVLLHDTKATGQTVKALPDIIQWFREQGYTFCTVAQMQAVKDEVSQPNEQPAG